MLYAATPSGVFKSTDAAASWSLAGLTNVSHVAVCASNPSVVYAATLFGDVFSSFDGGNGWTLVRQSQVTSLTPTALAIDPVDPNTLYLGLPGEGVLKSKDGGQTWANVNSGLYLRDVASIAIDPSDSNTIYLANGAGVFKTTTAAE